MKIVEGNERLKKLAEELMKIPGNLRGEILQDHGRHILEKKGEEGLKEVERKLKELGIPFEFKKVKRLNWYPDALSHLILLVSQNLFGWQESEFFEMGRTAPLHSFVVKVFLKYFLSIEQIFKSAGKFWQRYFDFGELEPYQINLKEGYAILRLKNYKIHPIGCVYKRGYFTTLVSFTLPDKEISVQETRCVHKGDPFCEFLIKWQ